MDEVEKFNAVLENWRRTFGLECFSHAGYGKISIEIHMGDRLIVSRKNEAENKNDEAEFEEMRQNTYRRAREDLTMWLGWQIEKYNFKRAI